MSPAPHTLFVSPSAEQRLACASEFLRALPAREPALILVPNLAAGAPLMARVLDAGEARFAWRRRTLGQLARELALPQLAREGRVPLSGLSQEALVARVLHELGAAQLGRHAALLERPGYARAMSKTLDELRMSELSHERLSAVAPELARVLSGYREALDALRLADRAYIHAAAVRAALEHVSELPLLALDVPLTHQCEASFASALGQGRSRACATVARGDERSELHWRSALGRSVEPVRKAPSTLDDLARLQNGLFGRSEPRRQEGASNVSIVSSPGEAREAVEIARGVLEAAARGVPFDRMAVLLRAVEGYRAELEEALARARIPAHFADGVRRPRPEGRAFLALLACAREGLSARAFAEYLSLGAHVREDGEGATATPRRWERMLVDAAVIGGRERWTRRIEGLRRELEDQLALLEADDPARERTAREVAQLRALASFATPILDRLHALPRRATWEVWISELSALARASLRSAEGVTQLLAELSPLAPVGPVTLLEVERVLAARLSSFVLPSTGLGAGKLFVGTIEDARGRAFDRVFVPGLAERVFPPRIAEDPLLPDELRRALGGELWLADERVARERLLLRIAVGAARERLVLSFPRFDLAHGRPRVPSFYGLEVLQAIDGALPAFDELGRRADPGAAARMGFPAPDDAARAIDDAEYDLSMLARVAGADPARRAGAFHYLLQANPHLARALRFRARRWELAKFSPADGFVANSAAGAALLAEHRLSARSYSASALSLLAACPYRFYLHSIAGIAERAELCAIDELDARQRGVLFHRAQRAVLSELAACGMLPLTAQHLARAREILRERFAQLSAEARDQYAPSIDGVFETGLAAIARDLDEWLARMLEEQVFVPRHFELAFGLRRAEELDHASTPEPVRLPVGLSLIGAIDLVEQSGQGEHALLRATDHKTGRAPERAGTVQGGRSLQPLLYALALEQLFPGAQVASGRLYFCTTRGEFTSIEVPLDGAARALAKELVTTVDKLIEHGFLPAAPAVLREDEERNECERCAYRAICGPYEAERVAVVKEPARLQPLFHLRNLP